ncbi:MAG: tetratricopeptide repeat protein [Acidobacteria bacterium]|nr:tetratricopeptide repeat protein [Acidobacteriota bacterium]
MTKDHVLTLIIGVLLGFISGYMIHERMAEVHPQPRVHGAAEAAAMAPPAMPPQGGGAPNAMVQELQARLQQDPNDTDAILRLANLNFDISNWSRAKELYDRYLELEPGDPNILSDMGVCLRNMQEFDQALAAFDRALEKTPDHWLSRFNKAIVLGIDMGEYDQAETVIAELRQMRPDAPEVDRLAQELERRRASG